MAVNRTFAGNYDLQGGQLYFKKVGDTEYEYFCATSSLKTNFKTTKIEHKNTEGNVSVLDMQVATDISGTVSFETEDLNNTVMAIAFGGDFTTTTQAAGTATAEALPKTLVAKKVYPLAFKKITKGSVVVKYSKGSKTAVEGTDYSIDYIFGTIEIADNGVLSAQTDVTVDYAYEATTLTEIRSLNKVSQELSLKFVSNPQAGRAKEYIINKVILALDGDYSFKDLTSFAKISLSGDILEDNTQLDGKKFIQTTVIG